MSDADKRAKDEAPLFREFEHTGDLGIELTAPTRAELFRRAALAIASLLVETTDVKPREKRVLAVEADTDGDLLHDLLTELLNLFMVESFIWSDAAVSEFRRGLQVAVYGEPFDLGRHIFAGEIKAVTYHQLTMERLTDGWYARVIFDV